jgi:uncharacterized protein
MTPGIVDIPGKVQVSVAIVETPEEQSRGLSRRASLPESEGMIFWFGRRADHGFYMRQTLIPLDLLFVDFNRVVGILTLQPMDLTVHRIGRPSSSVLEVNGGFAVRHGVQIGDLVQISLA